MSNYKAYTRHPYTKEFSMATWLDDHYGAHRYGVRFPNGDTFNPLTMDLEVKSFDDRMYEVYCDWWKERKEDIEKERETKTLVLKDADYFALGLEYHRLRESYNF